MADWVRGRELLTRGPLMFVQLMNTKLGEKYPPIREQAENHPPMRTLLTGNVQRSNDSGSHVGSPYHRFALFVFL
jgi:hypothetical protein